MSTVSRGTYKDQDAVILENEHVRAVLLPSWGAKTISLVHKGLGAETLWQNSAPAFKRSGYGDPYGDGEFAGFDEMFPTISRCFYEAAPWAGVEAPDHGEVWTVPWEAVIQGDSVTMSVSGTRFPYTLQKTVRLEGRKLVAHYAAVNHSSAPLDYIWAAHPLFNATEGMRFVVPGGMSTIINAVPGSTLGGYGVHCNFPLARCADEKEVRLDCVPPRNTTGYQKYWFARKVTEGWCLLHDPKSTLSIGMSFPAEKVPYLGLWLNEGSFAEQYNIAPEPATAAMDRIDLSKIWGMGSVLAPRGRHDWHLAITLGDGKEPRAMTANGEFTY